MNLNELPRLDLGPLTMRPSHLWCEWHGDPVYLTRRAYHVTHILATHSPNLLNRDQIMPLLYPDGTPRRPGRSRAVDSTVRHARALFLLTDPGFSELETLYGVGYRWRGP